MYCERCNIDFPESLRYCKWCGQHLTHRAHATTHIRRCEGCGHVVKSAWSYCRSCGARLSQAPIQPQVICVGCGEVVEPPGLVCRVCGLEVPQEEDQDADLLAALDAAPGTYSYCASCGVRLDPQTSRCPSCGLPVTRRQLPADVLQTCPICKTQNRRGTGTCGGCGAALSTSATTGGDLIARAAGGPPTLQDVPAPAKTEPAPAGADSAGPDRQEQPQSAAPDPKSDALPVVEISYTEILGSWTPPHETPGREAASIPGNPSNGGSLSAQPADTSMADKGPDEFKTNVMPAVDLSQDLSDDPGGSGSTPTESLPTGSLPGSRPTSVFNPNELPFEPSEVSRASEPSSPGPEPNLPSQMPAQDSMGALEPFQVRKMDEPQKLPQPPRLPEAETQRVEPRSRAEATVPIVITTSADNRPLSGNRSPALQQPQASINSEPTGAPPEAASGANMPHTPPADPLTAAPVTPTPAAPAQTSPPFVGQVGAPGPGRTAPAPPGPAVTAPADASVGARHPKQVPPEVAHYMAYMDRGHAEQRSPAAPPAPAKQPARTGKSRLVPIALATGVLAIVILAGLGYFVWRFRQGHSQSFGKTQPTPSGPVDTGQVAVQPAPSPSATVKQSLLPEGMVVVPGGTYIIGRDDGDDHLAAPKHTVTLAAFYIDKTEVTNAQYKQFIDATGHVTPGAWKGIDFPEGKASYPVIDVRWQDAADYATWAGKRLPTEAEWEAAARGPDGRLFPWGDRWQSGMANVATMGIDQVGSYPAGASPTGALDMIGNVWEWTADELKLYPGSPGKLPESVAPGIVYRVIRGGAFDSKQDASYRGFVDASKGYPKTGFRCVRSVE